MSYQSNKNVLPNLLASVKTDGVVTERSELLKLIAQVVNCHGRESKIPGEIVKSIRGVYDAWVASGALVVDQDWLIGELFELLNEDAVIKFNGAKPLIVSGPIIANREAALRMGLVDLLNELDAEPQSFTPCLVTQKVVDLLTGSKLQHFDVATVRMLRAIHEGHVAIGDYSKGYRGYLRAMQQFLSEGEMNVFQGDEPVVLETITDNEPFILTLGDGTTGLYPVLVDSADSGVVGVGFNRDDAKGHGVVSDNLREDPDMVLTFASTRSIDVLITQLLLARQHLAEFEETPSEWLRSLKHIAEGRAAFAKEHDISCVFSVFADSLCKPRGEDDRKTIYDLAEYLNGIVNSCSRLSFKNPVDGDELKSVIVSGETTNLINLLESFTNETTLVVNQPILSYIIQNVKHMDSTDRAGISVLCSLYVEICKLCKDEQLLNWFRSQMKEVLAAEFYQAMIEAPTKTQGEGGFKSRDEDAVTVIRSLIEGMGNGLVKEMNDHVLAAVVVNVRKLIDYDFFNSDDAELIGELYRVMLRLDPDYDYSKLLNLLSEELVKELYQVATRTTTPDSTVKRAKVGLKTIPEPTTYQSAITDINNTYDYLVRGCITAGFDMFARDIFAQIDALQGCGPLVDSEVQLLRPVYLKLKEVFHFHDFTDFNDKLREKVGSANYEAITSPEV